MLIKRSVLDNFYGTNIFDVYSLAEHSIYL